MAPPQTDAPLQGGDGTILALGGKMAPPQTDSPIQGGDGTILHRLTYAPLQGGDGTIMLVLQGTTD